MNLTWPAASAEHLGVTLANEKTDRDERLLLIATGRVAPGFLFIAFFIVLQRVGVDAYIYAEYGLVSNRLDVVFLILLDLEY